MDWTTIIASCIPAIISALVSYLIARHQGKSDIKKAAQENSAAIEQLMKQHEIDIESLREKHRMDMEAKEKDHEYKLQQMRTEYELKVAESKSKKTDDITNDLAAGFIQDFMQNPTEGAKAYESLKRLQHMFNGGK